ncbi:DUF5133 domain-containing protein [Streptomyces sp. NPDC004542]|uniref:DUF5133 domain-containing protein n=1 Tax=Streptomyces sp. NPDC004542 TaxID=3154281 RepID=UPI0033B01583
MLIPLRPHPATLRKLVEEYEGLLADDGGRDASGGGPRARDLAYTLCVLTGTRDVSAALEAAHRHLAAAGPRPEPVTGAAGTLRTATAPEPVTVAQAGVG